MQRGILVSPVFRMRSQVQGSPFGVIFLSVRRPQIGLLLTLVICLQLLDLPAIALALPAIALLRRRAGSGEAGGPARSSLNTDLFLQPCPEQPQ